MQSSCLELEERGRVEETRMQNNAKSKKKREKVEGLLMLSSCLELEEKRRSVEGTSWYPGSGVVLDCIDS